MYRLAFLPILLIISTFTATSQAVLFNYGNPKTTDNMHNACRAQDGGILSVGDADSEDWDGWDGTLTKTDHLGGLVFRTRLGSVRWNEHALAVAEDPAGKIWVGGTADSANVRRAWLMYRNPAGGPIWERTLFQHSGSETSVQDIKLSRDGQRLALVGLSGGRVWFALWTASGERVLEQKFDRIDGQQNLTAEKAVLTESGDGWLVYGCGKIGNGKRQVFVLKINAKGELLASALYLPDDDVVNTGTCVLTTGGSLLGVGTAKVPNLQEEAFTFYIPANLDRRQIAFRTFGGRKREGRRLDEANDIVVLDAQTCLVVGSTSSHRPGATVPNMATWRVDHSGQRLESADMADFGGDLAERAVRGLRMYSGDVWLCGEVNDGNRFRDDRNFAFAKIESLTLPYAAAAVSGAVTLSASSTAPTVQPGNTSTVAVEVVNQANTSVEGMFLTANCPNNLPGCHNGLRFALPPLQAGERYLANIPIWADREAQPGDSPLNIRLNNSNGDVLAQKNTTLTVGAAQRPHIQIVNAEAVGSRKAQLVRGQKTDVEIVLRNTGSAEAKNVTLAFHPSEGLALSSKDFVEKTWPVGSTRTYHLSLTAGLGAASKTGLKIFMSGENLGAASDMSIEFDVANVASAAAPEPTGQPLPANIDLEIRWDDGSDLMSRRSNQKEIQLAVEVSGNVAVTLADIWLLRSHEGRLDSMSFQGIKSDKVQLLRKNMSAVIFIYRASNLLTLKPGENVLQMVVKKGTKRSVTAAMTVRYKSKETTLHVLSIGVPDPRDQLKYTQKDARDMAALFAQQQGKMFDNVEVRVLTTLEETRAEAISQAVNEFGLMSRRGLLRPDDAVLVFISTHGILSEEDKQLRLLSSTFSAGNQKYTSLSPQEDILRVLDTLPCRKFVLMDACHSGAFANGGRKGSGQVCVVASCAAQESSYEDDASQNGAFTKVLKDLLSNPAACRSLDTDGTPGLSMAEVFGRLQTEVGALVRTTRGKEVKQTPYWEAGAEKGGVWGY